MIHTIHQRKLIRMFPDYCSTGLWDSENGHNVEPAELGVSLGLRIALSYWHRYWELNIANDVWTDEADKPEPSYTAKRAIARWVVDGYELARLMTNESDVYRFEYEDY